MPLAYAPVRALSTLIASDLRFVRCSHQRGKPPLCSIWGFPDGIGVQEDRAFLREVVVAPRQFTLGDHVRLALGSFLANNNPQDVYAISRMMPPEADVWQYRVRREGDGQERAVGELQLVKV